MSVSNERGEASSEEMSAAEASSSEATPQKMKTDIRKKAKGSRGEFGFTYPFI